MKIYAALTLLLAFEPAMGLMEGLMAAFSPKKATLPKVDPDGKRLPPVTLDNKGLDNILKQNQAWKNEKISADKNFFKTLGSYHAPEYMYIGMHLSASLQFDSITYLITFFSNCCRLCRCSCAAGCHHGRKLRKYLRSPKRC